MPFQGYAWAEDKEHCEEFGRMMTADPSTVSARAKKRGMPQLGVPPPLPPGGGLPGNRAVGCSPRRPPGTLGAGNHYGEIQVVDKIFDKRAAKRMGIEAEGQVRPPSSLPFPRIALDTPSHRWILRRCA